MGGKRRGAGLRAKELGAVPDPCNASCATPVWANPITDYTGFPDAARENPGALQNVAPGLVPEPPFTPIGSEATVDRRPLTLPSPPSTGGEG